MATPRRQPNKRSSIRKNTLTASETRNFRALVYRHYATHGRLFPWRKESDPYRIMVSEVMLQQTQAPRVVKKYNAFIECFPTLQSLTRAPLSVVLKAWQGLGYNRRAKLLREAAQTIVREHRGLVPQEPKLLQKLPGIGPYTAAAIAVFAFNKKAVLIETNIRSVYLHHFFAEKKNVDDRKLAPLVEQTLDAANPREWYCALMDYGNRLKKIHENPGRRSAHHVKQSPFAGSNRELRGRILHLLLEKPNQNARAVARALGESRTSVQKNLAQMRREGLLRERASGFVAG